MGEFIMFVALLIVCMVLEVYMFQRQRAILEISREINMDIDFRKLIMPPWFIIAYITPLVMMYCLSQVFDLEWYFCVLLYLLWMFGSILIPIPKSFYADAVDKIDALYSKGKIPYNTLLTVWLMRLKLRYK